MNLFKKNALLMILVGISLVALVISFTTYAWLLVKVNDTIREAALASENVQLLAAKNAYTQTIRKIVRDTTDEREEINSYFITDEKLVSFLENIEGLGTRAGAGLEVQSVSVGDAIDKDGLVSPLKLSLKSEGTITEIYYILNLLEAYPKALSVKRVQMNQQADTLTWVGVFDIEVIKVLTLNANQYE